MIKDDDMMRFFEINELLKTIEEKEDEECASIRIKYLQYKKEIWDNMSKKDYQSFQKCFTYNNYIEESRELYFIEFCVATIFIVFWITNLVLFGTSKYLIFMLIIPILLMIHSISGILRYKRINKLKKEFEIEKAFN